MASRTFLLLLASALAFPLTLAAPQATCAASSKSVALADVTHGITRICQKITGEKSMFFAGLDDTISRDTILSFQFGNDNSADCRGAAADANNCRAQFESIIKACGSNNATFSGNGTVDTGCGVYSIASLPDGQSGKAPTGINKGGSPTSTSTRTASNAGNTSMPTSGKTKQNPVQGNGAQIVMASGSLLFGLGCIMTVFL